MRQRLKRGFTFMEPTTGVTIKAPLAAVGLPAVNFCLTGKGGDHA
jgi:hypothetical protein